MVAASQGGAAVLISFDQLQEFGITLTRQGIRNLIKKNLFPVPVRVGERAIAWREDEIVAYVDSLPRAPDVPLSRDRKPKPKRKTSAVAKARAAKKRHKVAA
jgi:predicted DNA-binding transcriptional regulator AlpA